MDDSRFSSDLNGLVLSLQFYLQKGDLQSLRRELPSLQRAALALDKRHQALLQENERLKDRLHKLERQSRTVHSSLRSNIDIHKSDLQAFHRFTQSIAIVQKMRSLRELSDILGELEASLQVDHIGLLLRRESFSGFMSGGARLLSEKALSQLDDRLRALFWERSFYIGPSQALRDAAGDLLEGQETFGHELPTGSCFVYELRDKYHPDRRLGYMLVLDSDADRFSQAKASDFLQHFCFLCGATLLSVLEHETLDREKVVDGLTGAYNREYLRRHARRILDFAQRKGFAVSLLYLDLDGFKSVNDALGHKAGDRLLQVVVESVQTDIRRYDIFVRLGGDEFVILMPGTDRKAAESFKARLRKRIEAVSVSVCSGQSTGLTVSASIGAVEWTGRQSLDELLQAGDRAMYKEKRSRKAGAG